jgi:hypothetical protein
VPVHVLPVVWQCPDDATHLLTALCQHQQTRHFTER